MPQAAWPLEHRGFLRTSRRELWWIQQVLTFLAFTAFIVYATWAAHQGEHYESGPYLSPFYSPLLYGDSSHAWFGAGPPSWWPSLVPFSAALLILWAPGLFRFTCYYYRGAYYKAFWADPPGCAVGEPRNTYWGERRFPLVLQNGHRYFLFIALAFVVLLAYDVWKAMWFTDAATGATEFGIGVGTVVLAVNVVLLGGYAFGCHSLRHLVGGRVDAVSESPLRSSCYSCVNGLNRRHNLWAWLSLFSVAFADIYVRLCSMGIWTDIRFI